MDLADNTQFLLVTWCFRNHIWNLKNMWVAHRARGAERKSERGAKRPTEAGADPLARGATHMWFFKFQIRFGKNIMLIRKKMLLSKIYISQPKTTMLYMWEHRLWSLYYTLHTSFNIYFLILNFTFGILIFVDQSSCVIDWWLSFLCRSNGMFQPP